MALDIPCIAVTQNLGEFYVASMDFRDLLKIVKRDPREWAEDESDLLTGVQRDIKQSRVNKISEYVSYDFATFPTSVVIALDDRFVDINPMENCKPLIKLTVKDFDDGEELVDKSECGYIIDGQHRLYGLMKASNDIENFSLNVSIFVGIDIADRAEIFSTVNLTQSKVNKSHVIDLYDYQAPPSPYRTAHDIVVALDKLPESPFYGRIKRLGIATPGRKKGSERLSQATVARGVLKYLPLNPDFERQKGILGLSHKSEVRENPKTRFLAPFYRRKDTTSILQLYLNFFTAIEHKWPIAWEDEEGELMLSLTNGYEALNRFLRDIYLHLNPDPQVPKVISIQAFNEQLEKIDISDEEFTSGIFPAGGPGASKLYHRLFKAWKNG